MSPWAFRKSLGEISLIFKLFRNVSGHIPEVDTFTMALQYRPVSYERSYKDRCSSFFLIILPYSTHLRYLSPSPGIPLSANSDRVGQELTKCPLSCRMSH